MDPITYLALAALAALPAVFKGRRWYMWFLLGVFATPFAAMPVLFFHAVHKCVDCGSKLEHGAVRCRACGVTQE